MPTLDVIVRSDHPVVHRPGCRGPDTWCYPGISHVNEEAAQFFSNTREGKDCIESRCDGSSRQERQCKQVANELVGEGFFHVGTCQSQVHDVLPQSLWPMEATSAQFHSRKDRLHGVPYCNLEIQHSSSEGSWWGEMALEMPQYCKVIFWTPAHDDVSEWYLFHVVSLADESMNGP